MTFGEKLRIYRDTYELTQEQLAAKLGTSKQVISRYENNLRSPKLSVAVNYARILGVPSNYFTDDEQDQLSPATTIPTGFSPLPETSSVPRVGGIACGTPILAEQNIETYDDVPKAWNADFTLVCSGDSMLPRIQHGDVVAIQKTSDIENGEVAAVRIDDEATLKHLYRYPDRLILQPTNPLYAPIVLIGEEMNRATIEGKAVGLCRDL